MLIWPCYNWTSTAPHGCHGFSDQHYQHWFNWSMGREGKQPRNVESVSMTSCHHGWYNHACSQGIIRDGVQLLHREVFPHIHCDKNYIHLYLIKHINQTNLMLKFFADLRVHWYAQCKFHLVYYCRIQLMLTHWGHQATRAKCSAPV